MNLIWIHLKPIQVPIAHYNPRIKDEVRKYYIQKGPCQPKMDSYPPTEIEKRMCQFCKSWFEGPYSKWLEYGVEKDWVYVYVVIYAKMIF